ncbi:ABC transporter permease [Salipiger aestuarii]|uniref:Amino acid/amide ABC transporter membrane protein 1 (HAAT family) n=1 Tax=Salipiger aestuarii TaxID=568098 RepID=A0A327XRA7_9RHOB|nr:branched-chain amino acid ABC transporter permease [Salipiger aestuarii]EIE48737.1 branched chain amino acid ABC transporter inner membrane protein [Citreicella sp. 357]KAA8605211.1 ABC transporter permease [Salipiger aestuarii]KAB2536843.1 ABC transporter permease [Salipiger aestuarii]RAK11263.1 amino acid/amide ABC transporter membrane protein 1 (HAAT family) [Salipiger aestuarii]
MELFVQLLANTLQIGAVYVLFALGLTLIFGVMKIVNFAHGGFFTAAALIVTSVVPFATVELGAPLWAGYLLAAIVAIVVVLCLGALVYGIGFQHVLKDLNGSFILSIGLLLILNGAYLAIYGGAPRTVPQVLPGTVSIFGAALTAQRLALVIVAAVVTGGLYLLIERTRLGLALRAVAMDQEAAMLQGMPFKRVALYGFLIGAALAACAGVLMAPINAVTPVSGDEFLIKAFIIIIIGGLGSVPGAIIGGLFIALIESVGGYFFDPSTATLATFILVIAFLLVRPQGILGNVE